MCANEAHQESEHEITQRQHSHAAQHSRGAQAGVALYSRKASPTRKLIASVRPNASSSGEWSMGRYAREEPSERRVWNYAAFASAAAPAPGASALSAMTGVPFSAAATARFTARKLSGVTDIESIPCSTRKRANSG